jgi:Holliday junction DNA helicase RuvA
MLGYIKGIIAEAGESALIIEAGGIGYEVIASGAALSAFNRVGGEAKLFTHMAVREDDVTLYGFVSKIEKSMFLRLISVSGIGPKVAINILSSVGLGELSAAVGSGNTALLSSLKGIGKKTAERIILELKDKIGAEFGSVLPYSGAADSPVYQNEDAVMALVSLGYSKYDAAATVNKLSKENLTTEQIVMRALKG